MSHSPKSQLLKSASILHSSTFSSVSVTGQSLLKELTLKKSGIGRLCILSRLTSLNTYNNGTKLVPLFANKQTNKQGGKKKQNMFAGKLKWFALYRDRKWIWIPNFMWKSLIQLPLRLSPKLLQLFCCSIMLLLIRSNTRWIAVPWGSFLMKAFNKMLLQTWYISAVSRRPSITSVRTCGSRTTRLQHSCLQSPATDSILSPFQQLTIHQTFLFTLILQRTYSIFWSTVSSEPIASNDRAIRIYTN